MEVGFSVCAVLPAAGSGERFGTATPKQYCKLMDRPLVSYTLEAFESVKWVDRIVLVVSADRKAEVEEIIKTFNHTRVSIALGQSARHRSIFNGIKAFKEDNLDPDVVIIHDAVRPFVKEDILRQVAIAAYEHGASGAIRPLVSTVIGAGPEGIIDESLDRSKYRASEMPQAFRYEVISKAYHSCTDFDLDYGTECLHLAQKYSGIRARLIEGDPNLWKVTHKRDMYAAEGMIKERYNKVVITGEVPTDDEIRFSLESAMKKHSLQVVYSPDIEKVEDLNLGYMCCLYFTREDSSSLLEQVSLFALKGRHKSTTCGLIIVLITNSGEGNQGCIEKGLMLTAEKLKEKRLYLNLITAEAEVNESSKPLQPLPEIAAEVAFHRNMVFTGQKYRSRLK